MSEDTLQRFKNPQVHGRGFWHADPLNQSLLMFLRKSIGDFEDGPHLLPDVLGNTFILGEDQIGKALQKIHRLLKDVVDFSQGVIAKEDMATNHASQPIHNPFNIIGHSIETGGDGEVRLYPLLSLLIRGAL